MFARLLEHAATRAKSPRTKSLRSLFLLFWWGTAKELGEQLAAYYDSVATQIEPSFPQSLQFFPASACFTALMRVFFLIVCDFWFHSNDHFDLQGRSVSVCRIDAEFQQ